MFEDGRIIVESDCVVCGRELACTGEEEAQGIAVVMRGYAEVCPREDDPSRNVCVLEDAKFSRMICQKCFLEDEDLCRFFNKLGLRVR